MTRFASASAPAPVDAWQRTYVDDVPRELEHDRLLALGNVSVLHAQRAHAD